ncbi:C4-type zinc ribbon domain-containing protein [Helicobacter sp. MIT 21-1697]|uniref:zinc ribbon domain-containing protein n=1 Tax=Helicobacter sp. MIT 21-1697 TaxID=2993733 RepID=UPI00224B65BA|nr:C4-type zinc ribbon domain-containing protein [Helicobacter sp. MIT 21-1697]MCX2716225.1 C4-type zinc ribbon domain-containing protein [Helicobacter sp. MIT 21-1697]
MNKHLKELIEVANFDKQIDDLEPEISQARSKLDEQIKQQEQILKNIEKLNRDSSSIELEISHHDRNIQDASSKLEQISKKQKEIKTEKEMRALDVESDIAKENMTHSNSEIERLEALKKAKEEEKKAYEPKLEELKSLIKTLEEQTQSQVQEIKKAQQELFDKKQALVAQMDSKITSFYAKIRRWAGNTSVVCVFKQACGGCFIKLNDTIYSEILKGNDIINCPHCGRILYANPSSDNTQTSSSADEEKSQSKKKSKA